MSVVIRAAVEQDAPAILSLIRELADYERLSHAVEATTEDIVATLFRERPAAEALVAELDGAAVGMAIFFSSYSTFLGRAGIYLEDLFVQPAHRGQGIGKRLLGEVARIALARGCRRLEWAVLDWNEPSIEFYKSLGAEPMEEWTTYRMSPEAMKRLAGAKGW